MKIVAPGGIFPAVQGRRGRALSPDPRERWLVFQGEDCLQDLQSQFVHMPENEHNGDGDELIRKYKLNQSDKETWALFISH